VNFRNVLTSVAQQILQAFLKLAVINPLLNAIFPGSDHRSTLGDVFGALENVTPGSSSTTTSGGGGATGILGTIIGLVGKIGGLFGGGGSSAFDPGSLGYVGDASGLTPGGAALQSLGFFSPLPAHHAGGIVGANDNLPMTLVPTSMIAGAARFHNGSSNDLNMVLRQATDVMARRMNMPKLQPDEIPAVLLRNERVLTEQQDNALRNMIGGLSDQLAVFKGTGTDGHRFTPDLPTFHGGTGAGEFSSIMQRGLQLISSPPAPGSQTPSTKQEGDTVHISIDARNSTPEAVSSFRRSMPQIASIMSDQLSRAKIRNR
jgi:hypothetical protein